MLFGSTNLHILLFSLNKSKILKSTSYYFRPPKILWTIKFSIIYSYLDYLPEHWKTVAVVFNYHD